MSYQSIQQQHLLERLRQRRVVNLHFESLKMQTAHHQKMFRHVDEASLAYAAMVGRLQDISDSLRKLAVKPRWRFWP